MEFDVGYGALLVWKLSTAPVAEAARPEGMSEGGTETPEGAMI